MAEINDVERRFTRLKKELFDKYYRTLNERQREAVYTVDNPLLVLAGAGSGKTTVLVRRIAHIIRFGNAYNENRPGITEADVAALERVKDGSDEQIADALAAYAVNPCPPWAMLSITFTNKAANEMKERLNRVIGEQAAGEIWAGTFHSVCVRLLRRYGAAIGLDRGFAIYDTDDCKKIISQILKERGIDEKVLPPKKVMNAVSRAKDQLLTPDDLAGQAANDFRGQQIAKVYAAYQQRLKDAGAVDFDDIIVRTVDLLTGDAATRDYIQKHFRYVCIDEYQDTNHAQFVLATLLSGGRRNLMVVGDDDQSIYRFRGATIENILGFDRAFPEAKVVKLEQNYRSTQTILSAANAVISHNAGRRGKSLWTAGDGGGPIVMNRLQSQSDEAEYIADKILQMCREQGRKYSDFAILYRMNVQSNALEKVFVKSGVPYRVIGGTRFTERKEIRDVIAYLSLILNPRDDLRLMRIINEPKRKIGGTTIRAIQEIARAEGKSMFEVIQNSRSYVALSKSAGNLTAFSDLILRLRAVAEQENPSGLIEQTLDLTGYREMLIAGGEAERERLENVQELISNAVEYESRAEEITLSGFLEEYALVSDVDNYDQSADAVVMMTIHSAKGLEFPVVFLPGMEDGIFPGLMSMADPGEMEEERRLAYVAITRAKEQLCCTFVRERMLFGRTQYNPPSKFLSEIPEDLVKDETIARKKPESHFELPEYNRKKPAAEAMKEKTVFDMKPKGSAELFSVGEIVEHPNFGRGEILSVRPMASDTLYEVAFDKVGTKKLMATYAKLKKAQ